MSATSYADSYRNVDFRKYPEKYKIGRGEQGVLIAEPYKSEILPYWKFATPEAAEKSAQKIYMLFLEYAEQDDFVGMDMARKFLQMGFTRSRRYANHPSGKKYTNNHKLIKQDPGWKNSDKAKSAEIFYTKYIQAKNSQKYLKLKDIHTSKR